MKKKIVFPMLIFVLALAALACTTLTGTADNNYSYVSEPVQQNVQPIVPESAVQPDNPDSDYLPVELSEAGAEGALLLYDSSIWGALNVQVVEAALADMYQTPHPRHVQFTTMGGQGVISMVPVYNYSLSFADAETMIWELQADIDMPPVAGTTCISELPIRDYYHVCSHQEFVASPALATFSNGIGVRFVTNYGIQDMAPVDNTNLRYMFQGLTYDGQCYLSVEFNLSHSGLPQNGSIPEEVYMDATAESLAAYFEEFALYLSQNEAGYDPGLRAFDALIESFEVIQCGVNQ